MERIHQLLNQLNSLRNQSAHYGGFDTFLSPQNFLIFIVFERLSSTDDFSSPLAQQFINSIKNESFLALSELEKVRKYLPFEVGRLSRAEFSALSQGLIEECLREIGRGNEVFTPTKLNEILVEFINPSPNQIIYDPACGIGSTFVEIYKRFPDLNLKFIGQEINQFTYLLCLVNLLINGIKEAEIYCTDSINKFLHANKQLFNNEPLVDYRNKVDFAISEPPFYFQPIRSDNELTMFIDTMLSMCSDDGKVVVAVPELCLFSPRFEGKRVDYLSQDLIEKVISLPESIYSPVSSRKASIVVFNKNKKAKRKIIFNGIDFDNSQKFERTEVNSDSIIRTDLRANRYALHSIRDLDNLFKNTPHRVVKIEDVISFYRLGRHYSRSVVERYEKAETLPLVRTIDLPRDDDNSTLDFSRIERTAPKIRDYNFVDFRAVLCSFIGTNLRPTFFNYDGSPILIASDLIALKLNDRINVDYFLIQLKSDYVRAQLESISTSASFNRIRAEDFLNIQIILPPIKEQTRLAIEFLKAKQKELHQDISEEKKEAKLAEYDIISITVHDLNHKLGAMQNYLDVLKMFFEANLSDYLQKPIQPAFDDDTEEEINQLTLTDVLQGLINTRNEASAQLAATREELQNNTIRPIRNNFKRWLEKEAKPLYEHKIDFIVEGESIKFDFDSNRFKSLVRNLVDNAIQYNAKKVVFDLSYVNLGGGKQNAENIRILYKNDGDPFPADYDFNNVFKGLYQKSAKSKGTGIGGYSINRTVEMHNGEMNNVSPKRETFDLFPVQIELVLPIEYKPNQNYVKSNPYTVD